MRGVAFTLATLVAVGAAASLFVVSRRDGAESRLAAQLMRDVDRSGIAELARAQTLGRRLVIAWAAEDARAVATALAFVDAVLAVDYGIDTAAETEQLFAQLGPPRSDAARNDVWSMEIAARSMTSLQAGKREAAIGQATMAAAAAPGTAYPLYALGRARARDGDLAGAARALEAAIVANPGFSAARTAWAEVKLDRQDAAGARAALQGLLAQSPGDLRARLLLNEAEQALDVGEGAEGGGGLSGLEFCLVADETHAANSNPWPPPFVQASCALADAVAARRSGRRSLAIERALSALRVAPREPRLLARIAETLAQLGAVDLAAATLNRAQTLGGQDMPPIRWATAAVVLGRGRAPTFPEGGPSPADPEARLLLARGALAAGGLGELKEALAGLGQSAIAHDADLRLLARLHEGADPGQPRRSSAAVGAEDRNGVEPNDPMRAYVDGLRAQFRGDFPTAVERFWHALSGHGDACRAVGEYVATLRALKLPADPSAWQILPTQNTACVNLR